MSVVGMSAVGANALAWGRDAIARLAGEDTEFDADIVTPGVEGFLFTGLFAAAVIVLGIVLVRRLRRNQYRAEARERIAEELAERDAGEGSAPATPDAPQR